MVGQQKSNGPPAALSLQRELEKTRGRDLESWVLFDLGETIDSVSDDGKVEVVEQMQDDVQLALVTGLSVLQPDFAPGLGEEKPRDSDRRTVERPAVSWECETDGGTFAYDEDIAATIEDGYNRWISSNDLSHGTLPFTRAGISYEIDFTCSPMRQNRTDKKFDTTRLVHRKVVGVAGHGNDRLACFLQIQDPSAHSVRHPTHGYTTTPVHQLFNEHTWYRYQGDSPDTQDSYNISSKLRSHFDDTRSVIRAITTVHKKDREALMCEDQ